MSRVKTKLVAADGQVDWACLGPPTNSIAGA